jgi:NADH-quinone oxidoreductase subunit K
MTIQMLILLATALFVIGLTGLLIRKTALGLFLAIEIMFNAANLLFVTFARVHAQPLGQAFVFIILAVAAAEAAVGISLTLAIMRRQGTLDIDEMKLLKW